MNAREDMAHRLGIREDAPVLKRGDRAPHLCRDGHVAIRFWHSDDDARCPLCRTLDALVAETLQGDTT